MNLLGFGIYQKKHQFWDTQPVPQSTLEVLQSSEVKVLQPSAEDLKQLEIPTRLPPGYSWKELDLNSEIELEELHILLRDNYVEDEDAQFRFAYSKPFLKWALLAPGYKKEWHLSIVNNESQQLVGFISAIPQQMMIMKKHQYPTANINFLCLTKELRKQKLAPLLIKEISRRCRLHDLHFAVYTSGTLLPTPFSRPRYQIRKINVEKLLDIGFSFLSSNSKGKPDPIAAEKEYYNVPESTNLKNWRPMQKQDVSEVYQLISNYLSQFDLYPVYSEQEIEHWFTPVDNVMFTFVSDEEIETLPEATSTSSTKKQITSLSSFFIIPSTVIGNAQYSSMNTAFSFYSISKYPAVTPKMTVVEDTVILAKQQNCDALHMLNICGNTQQMFQELNFVLGTGYLNYYVFGLLCPSIPTENIGLVML